MRANASRTGSSAEGRDRSMHLPARATGQAGERPRENRRATHPLSEKPSVYLLAGRKT
jgi:hypothetical protein